MVSVEDVGICVGKIRKCFVDAWKKKVRELPYPSYWLVDEIKKWKIKNAKKTD